MSSALPTLTGDQSLVSGTTDASGDVISYGLSADIDVEVSFTAADGATRSTSVHVVLGQSDAAVTAQVATA